MKPIRNSAKGLIIHEGRLLAIRKRGTHDYFVLPGGGQEREETLVDAVRRECREEVGVDVVVNDLAFIREYIGKNHEFAEHDSDLHQVEFFFHCTVEDPEAAGWGDEPDRGQVGVEWLPLSQIESAPLYPKAIRSHLARMRSDMCGRYLGDIN